MKDYAVILAADLPSSREVLSITRKVGSVIDGIKIGAAALIESGAEILKRVREAMEDKPLLVDLKIADIGFHTGRGWDGTNAKIIGSLKGSGATHVTVHGFPGPMSVAEAVGTARDAGLHVLLLPLMSHATAGLFFSRPITQGRLTEETNAAGMNLDFPRSLACNDVTEAILALGEATDVYGYIGPATRPADLRRYRNFTKRPIWCPGFGRQDRLGRDLREQLREWARIVGPASAAIVGSAIFKTSDPMASASEIREIRDSVVEEI